MQDKTHSLNLFLRLWLSHGGFLSRLMYQSMAKKTALVPFKLSFLHFILLCLSSKLNIKWTRKSSMAHPYAYERLSISLLMAFCSHTLTIHFIIYSKCALSTVLIIYLFGVHMPLSNTYVFAVFAALAVGERVARGWLSEGSGEDLPCMFSASKSDVLKLVFPIS